ncbi:hypothetical protein KZP23_21425 [Echinicola marina]|uniref:tetratricopeptide repeat protein n=1 Tax=Echinicola marina TaxID=2859768 RepID=UPI001CF60BF5|nr:hypothetical protein [Echinicola marina]UCS93182.1 hypothetical protein KZP23_21425 [Echinicola marina]
MNIPINQSMLKQIMKHSYKYLILCITVVFSACNTRSIFDTAGKPNISVDRDPLVLHKDSIQFTLKASIPGGLVSEKSNYTLLPEYEYGEGALPLEEIEITVEDLAGKGQAVEIIKKMSFPYMEGMDRGKLRVKGLMEEVESGKSYTTPYIELAEGIISTPKLSRVGQFAPGENIPEVGAYMSYEGEFGNMSSHETAFFFAKEGSNINPAINNDAFEAQVEELVSKGEEINEILISGMASPDESNYDVLAAKRAQTLETYIKEALEKAGYAFETSDITFKLIKKEPDWLMFRYLLRTFDKIDMNERDKYFDIIYADDSYASKVTAMKELPSYKQFSREKFSEMQMAQVAFATDKELRDDPEISALANRYINGTAEGDELTEAELARAAEFNPGLNEKQLLYEAMLAKRGSALALNNLGVVYLNQAHRMIKVSDKNRKVNEAMKLFRMANDLRESAYATHNMGQAYLMWEDYGAAYLEISKANALSREDSVFNSFNEGKRGAIDIIRGDYKLATIRLDKAPETATNLFNKGLAYYLAQEYAEAGVAFEESALQNMEFGYAFYGLAMVAAENSDEERLYENLKKAVQRSPYLKRRAATDMEFEDYFSKPEFREAIR